MNQQFDNWYAQSDKAIFQILGNYIKQNRLSQNKTQQEVADLAKINRTTLVQLEQGEGGTMSSWVKVLRVLGQLEQLKSFEITTGLSPLQLAKLESKKRKKARTKHNSEQESLTDW